MTSSAAAAPPLPRENVWDYPRPPALEPVPQRLRVVWTSAKGEETILADSKASYRVLETSHPPTYYIPPSDVKTSLLQRSSKSSFCEWKGRATYFDLSPPSTSALATSPKKVASRIWTYETPTDRFIPIKNYLSFYASAATRAGEGGWKCFVGEEQVEAQDGDFYGGWKTSNLEGRMKGGKGTMGW
ncbi:hypothetical protein BCR35DRAFT_292586 [Leucosporidium creatinivorum]|uniref:DUF427 domain-containing protein n=1 Tax=Leucosporidium creatinivorum TaxID=106004 RepID=A0A1Y2EX92_9BASI|nr:hypothetical protein BCR35DRAFT_292586 [Leucosporidium creatinivorum]